MSRFRSRLGLAALTTVQSAARHAAQLAWASPTPAPVAAAMQVVVDALAVVAVAADAYPAVAGQDEWGSGLSRAARQIAAARATIARRWPGTEAETDTHPWSASTSAWAAMERARTALGMITALLDRRQAPAREGETGVLMR